METQITMVDQDGSATLSHMQMGPPSRQATWQWRRREALQGQYPWTGGSSGHGQVEGPVLEGNPGDHSLGCVKSEPTEGKC